MARKMFHRRHWLAVDLPTSVSSRFLISTVKPTRLKPLIADTGKNAFAIQLGHNYNAQQRQKESETIHEYFLPKLDRLLARIAPPTTESIISWSNWGLYSLFDLELFEVQETDKTRMHQPDIGAMAYHERVVRNGYWLHIAEPDLEHPRKLLLTSQDNNDPIRYADLIVDGYDRKRHELYGLGSTKLRLNSRSNGQVTDPDRD
ncbi:unnamed protein product [Clonostachys rhizophaga]|uniref:Uncharacterized protein n=1 Tax=Clonostachys rhizophaga TaxID=160324 RepID=A0A9N9V8M8_9HYPO|nr:unnamed protein product [Clonostachys rhizophaga]